MKSLFIKRSFLALSCLLTATGVIIGVLAGLARRSASAINPSMPTVVIDAGHGGIDNGVRGITTKCDEADVNLSIARYLFGSFNSAGFNCVMTRTSEAGLYGTTAKGFKSRDMLERKRIICESGADLVISVHQNYCPLPSKRGGTVFYDGHSEQGKLLALCVQRELNALYDLPRPNEALVGDYYMLKCTPNPSVIVECGFLSNARDDELLNTAAHRRALAYAIFKGAVTYLASA